MSQTHPSLAQASTFKRTGHGKSTRSGALWNAAMHYIGRPATGFWLLGILALLISTPVAGAVGGFIAFVALKATSPETAWLALATFVFYGALLGGMIAWPVTCLLLPLAYLLAHRRLRAPAWIILGAAAGVLRIAGEHLTSATGLGDSTIDLTMYVAGLLGGAAAGAVFWLAAAVARPLGRKDLKAPSVTPGRPG